MKFHSKARAVLIQLGVSALVSSAAAWVILKVWFPGPYRELSGGHMLALLVASINLVVGPLLTWVLFSPNKRRREIILDFSVVVAIQIAALAYGLHSAYLSRPIYLVHEVDRLIIVAATDVQNTLSKAPSELQHPTVGIVTTIGLREITNSAERMRSVELAIMGLDLSLRPEYWQALSVDNKKMLAQKAKPLADLLQRTPSIKEDVAALISRNNVQLDKLVYLPVVGRTATWSVVMNKTNLVFLGFLKVDGFTLP